MNHVPLERTSFRPENNTFYAVRQIISLVSIGIHFSLFNEVNSVLFWTLSLSYTFLYPLFIRFTPYIKNDAQRNMLIDSSIDGMFLGLWGFNPYLCGIYVSCITVINMTTGSIPFGIKGLAFLVFSALCGASIHGFYFRPDLPNTTLIIASIGLIIFVTIVGQKIYGINTRLRQARTSLQQQKEELLRLNNLANVVNTHLNVNVIMESVMEIMEELYPFEAMYILSFKDQQQHLEVTGIYGSSITQSEHFQFRDLYYDVELDKNSLFVHGLTKKKVIYLPRITQESVLMGAEKDQKLFAIKPSRSLAYFPIFIRDQVVGGACFINYKNSFELSKSDINRIQVYLIQVGTAVRNTTQLDEITRAKELAIEAQSKAEASEESKSRFLANMSHEIRTPLTAIMGYSEALQEDSVSCNDRQQFVTQILRSSNHLLSMINDILDISKIEASKIEIEKIDCNILELLFDIESYLLIKTKEKNLDFSINIEYPIPKIINSDPTRFKQILLNLCNNAVKFTHEGKISIDIKILTNHKLEIKVIDTGIGISASARSKIFSAFDQADTSTTRLFGGTGLGLYISKNLATLLGGDIVVDSEEGKGSTFTFTTPITIPVTSPAQLVRNQQQYTEHMDSIKALKNESKVPSLSGRVLLAEDNPENQNLISRLILQTSMEVDIVENGCEAVEIAKTKQYDIILLDMQMPIMGGKEAAINIKSAGITTPIVAFTANVMKHQIDEYKQLGFADVLEKPIIKEKLFQVLKHLPLNNQNAPKVMIVEDNDVNQLILMRHISKAHQYAEIMTADNGEEAVQLIKSHHFNLIFMDMEMPVMNGLDATKNIRALGCQTPIYMVSGNIDTDSIKRCFEAGATGHLHKPLDKNKILAVIENTIKLS